MAEEPVAATPEPAPAFDPLANPPVQFLVEDRPAPVPRGADGRFAAHPPAEPTPAVPVVADHPAALVQAAQEFGISDEEIAELPTRALFSQVSRLYKTQQQFIGQQAMQRQIQDSQVKPLPPAEEDFDIGDPDFEQQVDPLIVKTIKKLGLQSRKEIESLRSELSKRDQRDADRALRENVAAIDTAFASLGKQYEKIFGKGGGVALQKSGGPEFQRRIAALNAAGININEVNRETILGQLKGAADILFVLPSGADPYTAAQRVAAEPTPVKPTNGRFTEQEWEESALAHPTQRTPTELPEGDAKAVYNLTRKMQELELAKNPNAEIQAFFGK